MCCVKESRKRRRSWPLLDTFLATVGPDVMKVLLLDRGFINGPQIGRLKQEHGIDTVIPIRSDMNLQARRAWADEARHELGRIRTDASCAVARRDRRLAWPADASHRGEAGTQTAEDAWPSEEQNAWNQPSDPSRVRERTEIARFPGLTSWWDCPVPLTGVYSRDIYARRTRAGLVAGDDQRGLVRPPGA